MASQSAERLLDATAVEVGGARADSAAHMRADMNTGGHADDGADVGDGAEGGQDLGAHSAAVGAPAHERGCVGSVAAEPVTARPTVDAKKVVSVIATQARQGIRVGRGNACANATGDEGRQTGRGVFADAEAAVGVRGACAAGCAAVDVDECAAGNLAAPAAPAAPAAAHTHGHTEYTRGGRCRDDRDGQGSGHRAKVWPVVRILVPPTMQHCLHCSGHRKRPSVMSSIAPFRGGRWMATNADLRTLNSGLGWTWSVLHRYWRVPVLDHHQMTPCYRMW